MIAHQYNFNIYNSIIFAGIIQGLIFGAIVIFSKKYRDTSTLILAAMIVIFSLHNFQYYLTSTNLVRSRYFYGVFWTPGQLIMAPMMFFYGLKLLYPDKPIPKKTVIGMLTPFTIGLLAISYLKINYLYIEHKTKYLFVEVIIEFSGILLTMIILGRLLYLIRKAELEAKGFGENQVLSKLRWFRNIIRTFFILCFVWLGVTIDMVFFNATQEVWYIMWISLAVMIYWLGHVGIYKYGINEERKRIRSHSLDRSSITVMVDKQKSDHLTLFENLVVNQKYFLDPELTLDKIAEELNLSKSHLSRLINKELQTSFPDYINQLRIKEAQYYLKHPDFSNYTLVAIGLEAGFASKTTFNNTFKKVTGMTPSEYKNDTSIPVEELIIPS